MVLRLILTAFLLFLGSCAEDLSFDNPTDPNNNLNPVALLSSSLDSPSSSSVMSSGSSSSLSSSRTSSSSAGSSSSGINCGSKTYNPASQYCSDGTVKNYGKVTDGGGKAYKTVVIGTQTWMAENLNYNVSGRKCYGNNEANCTTYGGLYDWATVSEGVCPAGWHIPSTDEWKTLRDYVEVGKACTSCAGKYLKSKESWNSRNGEDAFGFAALPGGHVTSDGSFGYIGKYGQWWTSKEQDAEHGVFRRMSFENDSIGNYYDDKTISFSVRCVQNATNVSSSSSVVMSSSSNSIIYGASVTYEGETYKTVVIGTQTWMAKNLNYAAPGSKCGSGNSLTDANTTTCNTYGRLYDWETALSVCPSGWKLPDNEDWDRLYHYADGTTLTEFLYDSETAGNYLKATSGWVSGGNGEDTFGFAAMPGGYGNLAGGFFNVGSESNWWSSEEYDDEKAFYRYIGYDESAAYWDYDDKSYLHSVRCIKR